MRGVLAINNKLIVSMLLKAMLNRNLRGLFYNRFEAFLKENLEKSSQDLPKEITQKKLEYLMSMLNRTIINIDKGYFSKKLARKMIDSLAVNSFVGLEKTKRIRQKYKEKYGEMPPGFIVLSPTQKCNLKCTGCYAASDEKTCATLPFDVVEKIVDEAYNVFGQRFMTISGGEPFLYKDKDTGKTLFDIWKKYNDMFFLVYTNGTCITKEIAKKLFDTGNVTPAISVEGYEEETDERRSSGVYKLVLRAFSNLREAGVPFGISVTGTKRNVGLLLSNEFYRYYFEEQGATYMWQFQIMPIGRAVDTNLMLDPKQRVRLYYKWEELIETKKYPIADFWNSGILSNGCIAYARPSGYFYINWDGKITPCAFVPYYIDNVIDLYKNNKSLADAINTDFFRNGRKWQKEYGFANHLNAKNWLMPCSIRDHYRNFRNNILTKDAVPENNDAKLALSSGEYFRTLDEYDKELEEETKDIWEEKYAKQKSENKITMPP